MKLATAPVNWNNNDAPEYRKWLEVTDPSCVGWCLDCSHLAYGGGDTPGMLKAHRVRYLHIKDVVEKGSDGGKSDFTSNGSKQKKYEC